MTVTKVNNVGMLALLTAEKDKTFQFHFLLMGQGGRMTPSVIGWWLRLTCNSSEDKKTDGWIFYPALINSQFSVEWSSRCRLRAILATGTPLAVFSTCVVRGLAIALIYQTITLLVR